MPVRLVGMAIIYTVYLPLVIIKLQSKMEMMNSEEYLFKWDDSLSANKNMNLIEDVMRELAAQLEYLPGEPRDPSPPEEEKEEKAPDAQDQRQPVEEQERSVEIVKSIDANLEEEEKVDLPAPEFAMLRDHIEEEEKKQQANDSFEAEAEAAANLLQA